MSDAQQLKVDFAKEKEAGYRRIYARSPQLTSLAAGWNGVYFGYDYIPPGEAPEVVAKQHCIAIFSELAAPACVERSLDGCFRYDRVAQGDMVVVPANVGCRSRWTDPSGVIFWGIDSALFAQVAYEVVDPDRVELLPHFAKPDPLIYQMGLSLKAALERDGLASRLYGETMTNALMVHLLQHYSAQRPSFREYGGLPQHQLRQVTDYIQDHLDRDLSLQELAAIVSMSSHYFLQLFKQSTGITPHQFVIRCRVERAKELLLRGTVSIAEVARLVGFVDQSHLHRHFKRLLGITPKMLRQNAK